MINPYVINSTQFQLLFLSNLGTEDCHTFDSGLYIDVPIIFSSKEFQWLLKNLGNVQDKKFGIF